MKYIFALLLIAWVILNSVLIASTPLGVGIVCNTLDLNRCASASGLAGVVLLGPVGELSNYGLNENEISHMSDVSVLLDKVEVLWVLATVVMATVLVKKKEEFRYIVRLGIRMITRGGAILLASAVLAWRPFFDTFHKVFFPQGNWAFPAESLLINIYPEIFWQIMIIVIFVLIGVIFFLLHTFSNIYKYGKE